MAPAPFLVPCLTVLRAEFNAVAPRRDKGADGWIGDPAHAARKSDHNPDPAGRVLALDIDSSGPWPGGPAWFDEQIHALVVAERDRWLNPREVCRLEYVIWNRKIASKDVGDFRWRPYVGSSDDHTNHAHFSARHDHAGNTLTAPWGLLEDDMALADDQITLTADTAKELGRKAGEKLTAATLLQLAVIFAARGDDGVSALNQRAAQLEADLRDVQTKVAAISTGGAAINLDVLADKLIDRMIDRLQN